MTPISDKELTQLTQHLGYTFRDSTLLEAALSHRSLGDCNNERLEFLGDALLNFITAAELFRCYPQAREGELSRWRSSLVNGETLAVLARELKLDEHLRLGSGELKNGGMRRKSILAGALEALVGAIYLDAGLAVCQQLVLQWLQTRLTTLAAQPTLKDAKTRLQEYLQAHKLPLPEYRILATKGKAHAQIFQVECRVSGLPHTTKGTGNNRRLAEQQAAQQLLVLLEEQ